MNIITEKDCAEKSTTKRVSIFYKHYNFGSALKKAGVYKLKGVPVAAIIKYLIALIYTGKSMYEDMRSATPFAQGFCRDTVYRFLKQIHVDWQVFLLSVAYRVVAEFDKLTSKERLTAFIIDDTMYGVLFAKKTELVSWIHDHAEKGKGKFKKGFRMLTLGWSDGVSFIPLAFRHLASSDEKKQVCKQNPNLDMRSRAARIRKEAVSKATEVLLIQLKAALKAGITAKHVLFDSWFAYPSTIIKIHALKLHVTARVKNTTTIHYLVKGEKKTLKQIYQENKKRRGKSRYLLSVSASVSTTEDGKEIIIPVKLVYVRNKKKRKDWIAILTTDIDLTEDEVIALYGKRWDIEVFFKICKSYLKLANEFQQLSYDAITAHTTIVMIRYVILSVEKRMQDDPRSLGELFYVSHDEVADIKFNQAILLLMSLLADTLRDADFGLTEEQMDQILDKVMVAFIHNLPPDTRLCLHPGSAA